MREYIEKYDVTGRLETVWFNSHITLDKGGRNADFEINYWFKHLVTVESFEMGVRIGEALAKEETLREEVVLPEDVVKEIITRMSKKRLFVDLDGTAAVFKVVDTLETLYEKNYFLNLEPQHTVVDAVRHIIKNHPEVDVYILSSVLTDSKYALSEKNEWIDKYLPEIDSAHRIFPPCGENKKDYIEGGVGIADFLLDDYSHNLNAWEPPAKGIKIMNGINGTKGTWLSDKLSIEKNGAELAENIINIMEGKAHYQDAGPNLAIDNTEKSDLQLQGAGVIPRPIRRGR